MSNAEQNAQCLLLFLQWMKYSILIGRNESARIHRHVSNLNIWWHCVHTRIEFGKKIDGKNSLDQVDLLGLVLWALCTRQGVFSIYLIGCHPEKTWKTSVFNERIPCPSSQKIQAAIETTKSMAMLWINWDCRPFISINRQAKNTLPFVSLRLSIKCKFHTPPSAPDPISPVFLWVEEIRASVTQCDLLVIAALDCLFWRLISCVWLLLEIHLLKTSEFLY